MKDAVLGLDVGTSSTKGAVYDRSWKELARARSQPYRHLSRKPGWVEQNPEEVWAAVRQVIKRAASQAGPEVKITGLAIAAQSGSLLPADGVGSPVYPMVTWMDGRTRSLVDQWKAEGKEAQVRHLSGWSLYPGLPLPTAAWLHRHNPETHSRTERFCSLNDFLVQHLTGSWISNPSNAGGMQLVDINRGTWSEELCRMAGCTAAQLPDIRPSGEVIGAVRKKLAGELGLPEDIRLVNGAHDQTCTALGLGIVDPGKMLLACGTAWVISGAAGADLLERIPAGMDANFHAPPGRYMVSQSLGGLGASLEWWLKETWPGNRESRYADLDRALMDSDPKIGLLFRPLSGGHEDPATTGRGGFSGLQFSHTGVDLTRAVMESAGYELRWAVDSIQRTGLGVNELWMVGGAASSPHWPAYLASITGIPIALPAYDLWPCFGAAVLAAFGLGWLESLISGDWVGSPDRRRVQPDPGDQETYHKKFQAYQDLFAGKPGP